MVATYKVLNFNPFPVGMIVPFANHVAPPGYLLCDATNYTKTQYPELYAAIDEIYIVDEENFITPDMADSAVFNFGGLFEFGESAGQKNVTLNINQIPVHNHPDSGHSHTIALTTNGLAVAPGELPVVVPVPIIPDFTGTDFANVVEAGGGESHNNMPPYISLNYCIYAGR
jgi:microcystin-dependent protein